MIKNKEFNSTLSEQFFNAILLIYESSTILVGVLFVLCVASLGEILYLDHFSGSCGFVYALFRSKSCLMSLRNY
jgi:hypothetical protein